MRQHLQALAQGSTPDISDPIRHNQFTLFLSHTHSHPVYYTPIHTLAYHALVHMQENMTLQSE